MAVKANSLFTSIEGITAVARWEGLKKVGSGVTNPLVLNLGTSLYLMGCNKVSVRLWDIAGFGSTCSSMTWTRAGSATAAS